MKLKKKIHPSWYLFLFCVSRIISEIKAIMVNKRKKFPKGIKGCSSPPSPSSHIGKLS